MFTRAEGSSARVFFKGDSLSMKKRLILVLTSLLVLIAIFIAGGLYLTKHHDAHRKDLLLHLTFDEGQGLTVSDASEHLPATELSYGLAHAAFMEDQDPQWRTKGIKNGCLLFDGTTYLTYHKNDIAVEGNALTVSVWIAPRTFEWDDPNSAERGTDTLTGIIGQVNKEKKQGFLLGYHRHGRLSFQVGTGDDWLTIWTNGDNLQKYQWNLVTATFDASAGEMCLYLNGERVTSRSVPKDATIAHAKNRTLLIGRNGEGERLTAGFLNTTSGYLDEIKLYSCSLSSEEISKYYAGTEIPEIDFSDLWLQNILTTDYTRTQYHGAPYQFWMNEPHAPIFYNGKYHLFFQQNMSGSYWRNICWGHLVSDDMVNWKPVKEAIVPTENSVVPDGVWSGGATLDANGVPLLFFTAGNDDFLSEDGLISNQNIGIAYPADLTDPELTEWQICKDLAIIQKTGQGRRGEFRDPHIWVENGIWHMLICSGSTSSAGGTALLYTTDTLELLEDGTVSQNWIYKGPVYEMKNQSKLYGQTWELPIILPITNDAGTIRRHMLVFSPAPASIADNKIYYFLGTFDSSSGKFTQDESFGGIPRLLDYGANVFTGPSAFIDPVSGDVIMFSIMQDQRSAADQGASGWAHSAGLARRIRLTEDGSDLKLSPIDSLTTLESEALIDETNLSLDAANELLKAIKEDMYHLIITAKVNNADEFGIHLKKGGKWDCTSFTYEINTETIHGTTENRGEGAPTKAVSGALPLENDRIIMNIYVDRSLIEAFFNEYKAISIRAYTEEPDSHGIELFAAGDITIERLYVAPMNSIFE